MAVTPSQFDILSKVLGVTTLRHQVLAHNVANVNTPKFRRLDVLFENALAKQVARGDAADFGQVDPVVVEDFRGPFRVDENNVDINAEMARLNKNSLLHNAYIQILSSKLGTMRRAITGNRG